MSKFEYTKITEIEHPESLLINVTLDFSRDIMEKEAKEQNE